MSEMPWELIGVLVASGVSLWRIRHIEKSIRTLNHNSSAITKALLARKVLKPEDVKDVVV